MTIYQVFFDLINLEIICYRGKNKTLQNLKEISLKKMDRALLEILKTK